MLDGKDGVVYLLNNSQAVLLPYFSNRPYFRFQIDGILDYASAGQLVLDANLNRFL